MAVSVLVGGKVGSAGWPGSGCLVAVIWGGVGITGVGTIEVASTIPDGLGDIFSRQLASSITVSNIANILAHFVEGVVGRVGKATGPRFDAGLPLISIDLNTFIKW